MSRCFTSLFFILFLCANLCAGITGTDVLVLYSRHDQQGRLHADGQPARMLEDGTKEWYKHGKLHRYNGPAVESKHLLEWWRHGFLIERHCYDDNGFAHSLTEPAVYTALPHSEKWYKHGELHREDGPAVTSMTEQEWYLDGKLHRDGDEPASVVTTCEGAIIRKWYKHGRRTKIEIEFDPANLP